MSFADFCITTRQLFYELAKTPVSMDSSSVPWTNENAALLPWYVQELREVNEPARELFEKYAGLPAEEVIPHIQSVRDSALAIMPYPCIGAFAFLELSLMRLACYGEVKDRVKAGAKFLDLGCCFGQDLRKLVMDGASSENVFGSDANASFIALGYKLFRDHGALQDRFIVADLLNPGEALKKLQGDIDIINAQLFFHLFDMDEQVRIIRSVLGLLRPTTNTLLVGSQVGSATAKLQRVPSLGNVFVHSPESWAMLWEKMGAETGTKWQVRTDRGEPKRLDLIHAVHGEEAYLMTFEVRRIE